MFSKLVRFVTALKNRRGLKVSWTSVTACVYFMLSHTGKWCGFKQDSVLQVEGATWLRDGHQDQDVSNATWWRVSAFMQVSRLI